MKYDHMGCPFNDPPPEDLVTAREQLTLGLEVIKVQAADLAAARERILELESERDRLREVLGVANTYFGACSEPVAIMVRAALAQEEKGQPAVGTIPNYRETIVWPEHERPGKPRRELPVDPTPEEDDVFPRGPGGE